MCYKTLAMPRVSTRKDRNISRYDYLTTDFEGYRLSITRSGVTYTQYFSDRQHGSREAAHEAAFKMREHIFLEGKRRGSITEVLMELNAAKEAKKQEKVAV